MRVKMRDTIAMTGRFLCVLVFGVVLSACSGAETTPEAELRGYLKAIEAGDVRTAATFVIAEEAKAAEVRYLRESEAAAWMFKGAVHFEIGSVAVTDDNASVEVTVTKPELNGDESLQMLKAAVAGAKAERDEALASARQRKPVSSKERYLLVRQNGVWRVAPGWSAENNARSQDAALSRKAEEDAQRYAAQIPIKVAIVQGANAKLVEGTISNNTRASIGMLDIVIEYRDSAGAIVYEDTNHPVLTVKFDDPALRKVASNQPPIPPGKSRPFSYLLDDRLPATWNGRVTARVKKVEFDGQP